jgi:hypothetical protein
MIPVKIADVGPDDTMNIVRELRAQGLKQGLDFDFSYHQAQYDTDGWEAIQTRHAIFKFHTEKYATLFAIKYS